MLIYSIRHTNLEVLIIFPRPLRVQEKLLTYTILKNYKLLRLVRDKFLKCDLLERVNQINAKNEFLTENSGTPQVNTHDSVCMCICSTHTSAKVYQYWLLQYNPVISRHFCLDIFKSFLLFAFVVNNKIQNRQRSFILKEDVHLKCYSYTKVNA